MNIERRAAIKAAVKRTRTKLVVAVILAAAAAGAAGAATALGHRPAAATPSLDPTVATAAVTRQTLLDQIQVNGTIGYSGSYSVLNQYSPPPSASTVAKAQHAVDAARQNLSDTQGQIDYQSRQDAAAVAADQAQLASDQQHAPQQVAADQARLAQDQNKQQSDQLANQSKLHNAEQQLTSAEDSYNQATQPGGGGSGNASGGGSSGAYTSLPAAGQVMSRGQTLYSVNGRPIPLMYGSTPLVRQLTVGVSGDDVKELEDNLIALGYGSGLTADGNYAAADATAVKRWQAALGVAQTGAVNPGEAVFVPGALRVSAVKVQIGASAQAGQDVLDGTSPNHVVSVNLDARQQTLVQVGAPVTVTLPNNSTVKGAISDVGTVATTSGQGAQQQTTIPVTVTLADNSAAGKLDGATVTVNVTRASRQNVLTVPITALIAEPSGGYAVETADGHHHRIPVQTGLFSNGLVEVSGPGLHEGLKVLAPSL